MRVKFTTIRRSAGLGLLVAIVAGAAAGAAAGAGAAGSASAVSDMQVLQRWKLGGAGGWDYLALDAAGEHLFLSRATRVDVVDTQTGKVIGTVPNTAGVHGIALAEDLKRGYASNGKSDSVTVFDLKTFAVIQEVKIPGHNPDAILYEPAGKHVFTFNGKSKDVTVLDASSLAVIATLPVPDKPEFAVDDGKGHIYVNIESASGQISVIDSRKLSVTRTFPLPGCASPSGLAIDKPHHRLFSVCDEKTMAVTDAESGTQVARVPVGEGPDAAAFDAKRGLVLSSNGEGTLTVVRQDSADHYSVQATIATQRGARTMAFDEARGKIYLVTANFEPPAAATADQPHPRPVPTPDSFTVLVVGTR
ncbi:MAG TPA: YncE family protein [Steroidobacteraceae bacterium]|nr:YncE family protein [Steroidobacteraceae bacterium]